MSPNILLADLYTLAKLLTFFQHLWKLRTLTMYVISTKVWNSDTTLFFFSSSFSVFAVRYSCFWNTFSYLINDEDVVFFLSHCRFVCLFCSSFLSSVWLFYFSTCLCFSFFLCSYLRLCLNDIFYSLYLSISFPTLMMVFSGENKELFRLSMYRVVFFLWFLVYSPSSNPSPLHSASPFPSIHSTILPSLPPYLNLDHDQEIT